MAIAETLIVEEGSSRDCIDATYVRIAFRFVDPTKVGTTRPSA